MAIFNILGQKVRTLVGATIPEGRHQATWDGTDQVGNHLSSGVYLCVLSAGNTPLIRKMIYLK
jgi:flagellar hook assembly protein FlgD